MPEDAADRLLAHMEEVELAPEPAMITALCLFELEKVLVELLLAGPGSAVNSLQLGVFGIAAQYAPATLVQLEGLARDSRSRANAARRTDRQNRLAGRG